jgi:hypothetical protein
MNKCYGFYKLLTLLLHNIKLNYMINCNMVQRQYLVLKNGHEDKNLITLLEKT